MIDKNIHLNSCWNRDTWVIKIFIHYWEWRDQNLFTPSIVGGIDNYAHGGAIAVTRKSLQITHSAIPKQNCGMETATRLFQSIEALKFK